MTQKPSWLSLSSQSHRSLAFGNGPTTRSSQRSPVVDWVSQYLSPIQSHTSSIVDAVANSYSSRSCVWGVTARSLLYVIRDGANMTTVVRTRAPTRALSNFSLTRPFFRMACPSFPVDRRGLPSSGVAPATPPPSPAVSRPPRPHPGLCLRYLFLLLRARGFPRFSLNRGPPSCSSSRALRSLFEWGFLIPTFVSDVRLQARTEFRRFPRPSFLPRSGSRPQPSSSSSSPSWAAPAPSAFTAWS